MSEEDECRAPFARGRCTCLQCKNNACSHPACAQARSNAELLRATHTTPDGILSAPCCCRALFDATTRTFVDQQNKVCWYCWEAIRGVHGSVCCRWVWADTRTAYRTTVIMRPAAVVACAEHRPREETIRREELRREELRRETELSRRLLWCVAQGLVPANQHVWRAPASDEQNQAMGPAGLPWHADGSLRAEGVLCVRPPVLAPAANCVAQRWLCTKCKCVVPQTPRAFVGGPEPPWWWWCAACRKSSARVPDPAKPGSETVRNKRQRIAAAGCSDLRRTFHKQA